MEGGRSVGERAPSLAIDSKGVVGRLLPLANEEGVGVLLRIEVGLNRAVGLVGITVWLGGPACSTRFLSAGSVINKCGCSKCKGEGGGVGEGVGTGVGTGAVTGAVTLLDLSFSTDAAS